jgi:hypothetical protein
MNGGNDLGQLMQLHNDLEIPNLNLVVPPKWESDPLSVERGF